MKRYRLCFLGFGNVGRAFARLLVALLRGEGRRTLGPHGGRMVVAAGAREDHELIASSGVNRKAERILEQASDGSKMAGNSFENCKFRH